MTARPDVLPDTPQRVIRRWNREQGSLLQEPCCPCRSDPRSRSARRSCAGAYSEGGIASGARSCKNRAAPVGAPPGREPRVDRALARVRRVESRAGLAPTRTCHSCRSAPRSRSARRSCAGTCSEGGIASGARSYRKPCHPRRSDPRSRLARRRCAGACSEGGIASGARSPRLDRGGAPGSRSVRIPGGSFQPVCDQGPAERAGDEQEDEHIQRHGDPEAAPERGLD